MASTSTPMPIELGIDPNRLYLLEDLKRATRTEVGFWRSARLSGLRVLYCGRRAWVRGRDFIDWLESTASTNRWSTAKGAKNATAPAGTAGTLTPPAGNKELRNGGKREST